MTWERRWHPLREEWVTITSHRNTRPWSGSSRTNPATDAGNHDPECYLCPGNTRISGVRNPDFEGLYVFDNDHPSYQLPAPNTTDPVDAFYQVAPASGICRVICYSPRHNGSLASMSIEQTRALIDVWADQTQELVVHPEVSSVLIFENKGEVVGVSNNHPHGQIYAPGFVADGIRREAQVFAEADTALMTRILQAERADGRRIIASRSTATAFIPYFARFPYETYIVPEQKHTYLFELDKSERDDLASLLNEMLIRFDNLWQLPFPYMLLLHQAPCDGTYPDYHTHIQIHPPLRQPGLQKYLASVETGAGHFLNDGCPEEKAAELQAMACQHYSLS